MLDSTLKQAIENSLSKVLNQNCIINNSKPVGGGCINESVQIQTTVGNYFVKWNSKSLYPLMFEAEAKGLSLLRNARAICIPEVIAQNDFEDTSFLILEWAESGERKNNFWSDFGKNLAKLHGEIGNFFGLEHDNYIGSLPQSNKPHSSWKDFFFEERLQPQIKMAIDKKRLDHSIGKYFQHLFLRFDELIPRENPSLLHGDLWNGNYLVNNGGTATLIDPAVYYGHREMDLAMTKLFGGFDTSFYEAYKSEFPLLPGFTNRVPMHNLYPLLVHVNLFGEGYANEVTGILKSLK